MPLEEIQDILNKFSNAEMKIEQLLDKRELDSKTKQSSKLIEGNSAEIPYEEVIKRNKQILKDLEIVKGNLRSKAIFSPYEMQWDNICKQYRENPSLPVTTLRCHVPVFV